MNKKWWYAFDSKSILDNEKDRLTQYSFSNATEFYEQKVKLLEKKAIKNSSEVLNNRMELKIQVSKLAFQFYKLIIEQENLLEKDRVINNNDKKIVVLESEINEFQNYMKSLNPKQLEQKIREINDDFNKMMYYLDNQIISQTIKVLKESKNLCTHCITCERNCHINCDCIFRSFGRCRIFTFWRKRCEECGCNKDKHKQDNQCYTFEIITVKSN